MAVLSPRDVHCVTRLRERGVSLVEIKLTPMSPFLGQPLRMLPLPPDAHIMCLARGEDTLFQLGHTTLACNDVLFILCRQVRAVRQALHLDS
jgi:Trk K+ transport system NAD-binding subunit